MALSIHRQFFDDDHSLVQKDISLIENIELLDEDEIPFSNVLASDVEKIHDDNHLLYHSNSLPEINTMRRIDKVKKLNSFGLEHAKTEEAVRKGNELDQNIIGAVIGAEDPKTTNTPPSLEETTTKNTASTDILLVTEIKYNNLLLYNQELLATANQYGVVNQLIALGSDADVAKALLDSVKKDGAVHVIDTIFNTITSEISQGVAQDHLPLEYSNTEDTSSYPTHSSPTVFTAEVVALSARDILESGPTLKYFVREILRLDITVPELSNSAWMGVHFALGAIAAIILPADVSNLYKLGAVAIGTATYGAKIQLYENMHQYVQGSAILPMVGGQVLLSLVNGGMTKLLIPCLGAKAMIYDAAIAVSIGGLQYYETYHHDNNQQRSTIEKVIPYLADIMVGYIACKSMHLPGGNAVSKMFFIKKALSAVSGIVTTDYVTKIAMNVVSDYSGDYLRNLDNYAQEYVNSFFGYFYNECDQEDNIDLIAKNSNMEGEL